MKILKIIFIVLLISLIFTSGILLGKNLANKSNPLSINKFSPTITQESVSSIKIPLNETKYNYTHQTTGLSFNYPSDYKVTEQSMNGGIDFVSLNNNDGVKIDIYISDNPAGKTLDELVENFDREQEAGPLLMPKPIDKKYVSIAGERAMRRRWIESGTGDNIKGGDEIFFIHNGNFFEFIRFFNNIKRQNEFEDILQSTTFKGSSTYNFGKINFPYEKSWQMIENQRDENVINILFHIKSLCVNKEQKAIVANSEMNCDVTLTDYLPSKEQTTILNLNQFVNFISSQGRDETMPTPSIINFINDKNVSIIKWVGPHPLSGELIESYFFQYTDQTNQLHFVHVFGDPVRISANDALLKSFVDQVIKSIGVN
jgi:hypothetical protein